MRKQGLHRRCGAALLALLLAVACFTVPVLAREGIDLDKVSSIGVYFGENGRGFPGVNFSLYRVADVSESGGYTLAGDFADYNVSLEGLDSSGWRALAHTLAAYAARDGLSPLSIARTSTDGHVSFSGLQTGLYLVTGARYTSGGTVYTPEPMLVSLPGNGNPWDYSVEANCKFESSTDTTGNVTRKALKVWNDDGHENDRPSYVIVQLLENGEVADTVRLSESNNWSYTWEDLDADSTWQVVERDAPYGYTVSISREGITFVITNTYDGTPSPTPNPSTQPSPRPSTTPTPVPSSPPDNTGGNPPMIPQTGMLWWPVPLLTIAGVVLIFIGLRLRKHRGDRDER